MSLVIETADTTDAGGANGEGATNAITIPNYADGDLIVIIANTTSSANSANPYTVIPNGINGETITSVFNTTGDSSPGTESPNLYLGWYIGDGAGTSGDITFTSQDGARYGSFTIVVPAGEFDATTPISSATSSDGADLASDLIMPSFSANSDDAGGKLIVVPAADQDAISAAPTGYTNFQNTDYGRPSQALAGRDAAVTASESISSATWTISSANEWAIMAFIIREAAGSSSTTPFYYRRHIGFRYG